MREVDPSGWYIALVGTVATVVGAVAAVLQLTAKRPRRLRSPRSAWPDDSDDEDAWFTPALTKGLLEASLWALFVELVIWLIALVIGVRGGTIPMVLLMTPPAIFAAGCLVFAVRVMIRWRNGYPIWADRPPKGGPAPERDARLADRLSLIPAIIICCLVITTAYKIASPQLLHCNISTAKMLRDIRCR